MMVKFKGTIEVFGAGGVLMRIFVKSIECEGFGGFGMEAVFIKWGFGKWFFGVEDLLEGSGGGNTVCSFMIDMMLLRGLMTAERGVTVECRMKRMFKLSEKEFFVSGL